MHIERRGRENAASRAVVTEFGLGRDADGNAPRVGSGGCVLEVGLGDLARCGQRLILTTAHARARAGIRRRNRGCHGRCAGTSRTSYCRGCRHSERRRGSIRAAIGDRGVAGCRGRRTRIDIAAGAGIRDADHWRRREELAGADHRRVDRHANAVTGLGGTGAQRGEGRGNKQ